MQEFITAFMNQFGYAGIFFLIVIEIIFPPIPSELILTFGGFMTTYTTMSVPGVVLFATLGSVFGAILLYFCGRFLSRERLIYFAQSKIGHLLKLNVDDIDNAILRFQQKGNFAVFYCRLIPILRSLISIPAGMCHMSPTKFLLYTTTGSLIWNTILVYAGSLAGASSTYILAFLSRYSHISKRFLLLILCLLVFRHVHKKRKK